jgi:hypothetical protein
MKLPLSFRERNQLKVEQIVLLEQNTPESYKRLKEIQRIFDEDEQICRSIDYKNELDW